MNHLKTTLLLAGLSGLFLAVGYYLGGQSGMLMALIVAAAMNIGSYWYSDKLVLAMYGAKDLPKTEHPKVYNIVEELITSAGLPMPRLCVVDMPVANAFATGRDERHAVVAVTPRLLKLLSDDELKGVLAHELAHIKNRDTLISAVAATLAAALSYLAQLFYFTGGRSDDSRGGSPLGAMAMLILTPLVATLLHLAISRGREYLADDGGAKMVGEPFGLANALKKLHAEVKAHPLIGSPAQEATSHLFIVNPLQPSFITSLFSTHPPLGERVRRLEAME